MTTIWDKIILQQGDITQMDVDAIVNAANNDLKLGAGVAGAIRRKGGEQIQQECDAIGPIPIGSAAITSGGRLKARHVIHAASMQLGSHATAQSLRSSTAYSLRVASQHKLKSIAFPAVGTGVAAFPMRECAEIMLEEAVKSLESQSTIERIYFVLFDKNSHKIFKEVWKEMQRDNRPHA